MLVFRRTILSSLGPQTLAWLSPRLERGTSAPRSVSRRRRRLKQDRILGNASCIVWETPSDHSLTTHVALITSSLRPHDPSPQDAGRGEGKTHARSFPMQKVLRLSSLAVRARRSLCRLVFSSQYQSLPWTKNGEAEADFLFWTSLPLYMCTWLKISCIVYAGSPSTFFFEQNSSHMWKWNEVSIIHRSDAIDPTPNIYIHYTHAYTERMVACEAKCAAKSLYSDILNALFQTKENIQPFGCTQKNMTLRLSWVQLERKWPDQMERRTTSEKWSRIEGKLCSGSRKPLLNKL